MDLLLLLMWERRVDNFGTVPYGFCTFANLIDIVPNTAGILLVCTSIIVDMISSISIMISLM